MISNQADADERLRRRVRRTTWTTGVVAVLAIAGIAWALSLVLSAPDHFVAETKGDVDIGSVATDGIIPPAQEPAVWTPGTARTVCFIAEVDNTAGTQDGDFRFYAGPTTGGGLADYLTVEVARTTSPVTEATPGHVDCSTISTTNTVAESTFTAFASTFSSYATGKPVATIPQGTAEMWGFQFRFELPSTVTDDLSGLEADFDVAFENQ